MISPILINMAIALEKSQIVVKKVINLDNILKKMYII